MKRTGKIKSSNARRSPWKKFQCLELFQGALFLLGILLLPITSEAKLTEQPKDIFGNIEQKKRSLLSELQGILQQKEITNRQWATLLSAQSDAYVRRTLHEGILKRTELPIELFTKLLTHEQLAVRLGTLELLEELSGSSFNYNPWLDANLPANINALAEWQRWAENSDLQAEERNVFTTLSDEELRRQIDTLLSNRNPQRSARASRLLIDSKELAAKALQERVETLQPGSPAALRLKNVYYQILAAPLENVDAARIAQRLSSSNSETRAATCRNLSEIGPRAYPLLRENLKDPHPLVREAAAESLIEVLGAKGLNDIEILLSEEKDIDVQFAVLRTLSKVKDKRSDQILERYYSHENEDLVLIALSSSAHGNDEKISLNYSELRKLNMTPRSANSNEPEKKATKLESLGLCIADPRWRVRAAVLELIAKQELKAFESQVLNALDDPDSYVRFAALNALPETVSKSKSKAILLERFNTSPQLRPHIIHAFAALDLAVPEQLHPIILEMSNEEKLQVVDALSRSEDAALISELSKTGNEELKLAALRKQSYDFDENLDSLPSFNELLNSEDPHVLLSTIELTIDLLEENEPLRTKAISTSPPRPAPNDPVTQLLKAFKLDSPKPADEASQKQQLLANLLKLTKHTNPSIKTLSQLCLGIMAPPIGVESQALNKLSKRHQRSAMGLLLLGGPQGKKTAFSILGSLDEETRAATISTMLSTAQSSSEAATALNTLSNPNNKINAAKLSWHSARNISAKHPVIFRHWAKKQLDPNADVPNELRIATMALLIEQPKLCAPWLEPWITHTNAYIASAACASLGKIDNAAWEKHAMACAKHTSPLVRKAFLTGMSPASSSSNMNFYFDKEKYWSVYSYSASYSRVKKASPQITEAAKELLNDSDPEIAFMVTLYLSQSDKSISLQQLTAAFEALPAELQSSKGDELAAALRQKKLTPAAQPLLDLLRAAEVNNYYLKELEKKMGTSGKPAKEKKNLTTVLTRRSRPRKEPTLVNESFTVAVFHDPECVDCARIADWLKQLAASYPGLRIQRFDIATKEGKSIQEQFASNGLFPTAWVGKSPVVAAGSGALAPQDLKAISTLDQLLGNASAIPDSEWLPEPATMIVPPVQENTITPTGITQEPVPEEQIEAPRRHQILKHILTIMAVLLMISLLLFWMIIPWIARRITGGPA